MKKQKGITELTIEKNKFNGYNIRAQRNFLGFRQYESASMLKYPNKPSLNARMKIAHSLAVQKLGILTQMLDNPNNWKAGKLNQSAVKFIKNLGFITTEFPRALPVVVK